MPSCVVKICKNYKNKMKKCDGITYHRFPRNKIRRDEWTSIIRNCRGDSNWNPSSSSTVCSAHFDDVDFITTAKGLRCLVLDAIPKKLLSKSPEPQIQSTSPILQIALNARGMSNDQQPTSKDQQPTSSSSRIWSLPKIPIVKNEFNLTGYCRLCASSVSDGTLVDVESDNVMKELITKMSNRLNTNIDFNQEHLPTTVCSVCLKSLYTSYDFVVGIDLAQTTLNEILIQRHNYQMPVNLIQDTKVDLSNTSLQQTNPGSQDVCDSDQHWLYVSCETSSSQQLSPKLKEQPQTDLAQLSPTVPLSLDSRIERGLKYTLHKRRLLIDRQKKKIKTLNQRLRRFINRNESLKKILKNLRDKNFISPDLCNKLDEDIVAADLFNIFNRKKLKKKIIYSDAIKKFCLTLSDYSPRAYDYIRQSFDTCLPHRKSLARWYSHIKCEPGFTEESFQVPSTDLKEIRT